MSYRITIVRKNIHPDSVYIGRPTIFGNPFNMRTPADRNKVCDQYEQWFHEQLTNNNTELFNAIAQLHQRGCRDGYLKLGCFCAPRRCHGETIQRYLELNTDLLDTWD